MKLRITQMILTPNRTLPFYKTTCCNLRKHFLLAMSTFWQTRIMRHLTLISVLTFSLNAHKLDRTKKRGNGNIKTKPSIGLKQTTYRRGLSKYYVFCVGDKMIYHVSGKQCRFGAYSKVQDVFKLFSHTSVFTYYYVKYIAYTIWISIYILRIIHIPEINIVTSNGNIGYWTHIKSNLAVIMLNTHYIIEVTKFTCFIV